MKDRLVEHRRNGTENLDPEALRLLIRVKRLDDNLTLRQRAVRSALASCKPIGRIVQVGDRGIGSNW